MPIAQKVMTRPASFEERFSPFSLWIRNNPELDSRCQRLDIQDLDYIIHGFAREEVYLMLLEEKQFAATQTPSQRETHNLIHQSLEFTAKSKPLLQTMRGKKTLRYFGYHLIKFSHTNPVDSEYIWWDSQRISAKTLTLILSFVLNPYTLQPLIDEETASGNILSRNEEDLDYLDDVLEDYGGIFNHAVK